MDRIKITKKKKQREKKFYEVKKFYGTKELFYFPDFPWKNPKFDQNDL